MGSLAALTAAARDGQSLFESRIFLFLCFLGLSPLVLATLQTSRLVIDALSIWTGLCWGLLLFRLFAPPALTLKTALIVLLGTSFMVMPLFEVFLRLLPAGLDAWLESDNLLKRLIGFVFNVGVREEAFKGIPIVATLWLAPRLRQARVGVVLGMMAGIGFSATENVYYVYSTLSDAIDQTKATDMSALLMPIYNNLVRTMVGPFAHATFSGLFGAFAAVGLARGEASSLMSGLFASALLHGVYDTVVGVSGPLGAATLGVCLFLTMVAHRGVQDKEPLPSSGEGLFSRTIVRVPDRPTPPSRGPSTERPGLMQRWIIGTPDGEVGLVAGEPILIGRDSTACRLVLNDPAVSRVHAVVELKNGRPFITRESRGGMIRVNGAPVQNAELRLGDEIRLGNTVVRIELRAAPTRGALTSP